MPEYIKFKFNTKKEGLQESKIRIYPFVCWHIGAQQSDGQFIKDLIQKVKKDPNGYWVYMGDGGECVTRLSKGDLYEQTLSPQGQHDKLVDLLKPIADKGLFGIVGNHGNRIYKETGLSFDKNLCHRIGIPYLGQSAFVNLTVNRSSYDLYFHHGTDSGVSPQAKLNAAERFTKYINTDALFTAHSHVCISPQPAIVMSNDNNASKIRTNLRHQYICGSAYDSRSGYAEAKGYPPIIPSHIVVEFDGRIIEGKPQKKQKHEVFYSDGQHEIEEA